MIITHIEACKLYGGGIIGKTWVVRPFPLLYNITVKSYVQYLPAFSRLNDSPAECGGSLFG